MLLRWDTHPKNIIGGQYIATPKVIFNINYTPYKLKRNATPEQIEKHAQDRAFYNMTGDKNIGKYISTESKRAGVLQTEKYTIEQYLQKSTGLFNDNGFIDKEQLKDMKERVKNNQGNIWHGYISFSQDYSYLIDDEHDCIELLKRTFKPFFNDLQMPRDNIDLMCALHRDRPTHYHIHFIFWEKEPRIKNKRAKGYKYRAKGKLPMEVIEKMTLRLNNYQMSDEFKDARTEICQALNRDLYYQNLKQRDMLYLEFLDLYNTLPKGKRLYYANREMDKYRYMVDGFVQSVIASDLKLYTMHQWYMEQLKRLDTTLQRKYGNSYKDYLHSNEPFEMESSQEFTKGKDCPLIQDYKRRLGNIILKNIYILKDKKQELTDKQYNNTTKQRKRTAGMFTKIFAKNFNGFVASLPKIFEDNRLATFNRLTEIQKEIEEDRKKQEQQANEQAIKTKYSYSK